ncbi:MAG: 3-phosphoshikimate 1-carboxyvinyltransferase [Candidatus Eisenbacteria bacterium]
MDAGAGGRRLSGAAVPWRLHPAPFRSGGLSLPGDKSITHRAILLGALAEGETRITGANSGEDSEASLSAAAALGATVMREPGLLRLGGVAGRLREPLADLDCGNSGTSLRLLAGVVAGAPIHAVLTGDASLRRRPVDRIVFPLRAMGARLSARDGDRFPPLVVDGGGLRGADFDEPTASAQVASCILLAALSAAGPTRVLTLAGVRDHTVHTLRTFGVRVSADLVTGKPMKIQLEGPQVARATEVSIPGDPSAAAFFLAAAAATPGLSLEARGINLNPTRIGFLEVLARMGAEVEIRPRGEAAGEPVGDVKVTGPAALSATDVPRTLVPAMVDEVPAWAMAAALARGTSRMTGAGELRIKESDRLRVLSENLRVLGIEAHDSADGLTISGGTPRGGRILAHGDHRIAMAFAVLATRADGPVLVDDAASVATSFPGFESAFRSLGGRLDREVDTGDGMPGTSSRPGNPA